MQIIDLVAVLAVGQLVGFSVLVALARGKYGVKAPAVTGHESFERVYRVHQNTLELLVAFLPALYLAAKYWPDNWIAALGSVYLIGRLVFWRSYVQAPETRALGFSLSALPILAMLLAALMGAVLGDPA